MTVVVVLPAGMVTLGGRTSACLFEVARVTTVGVAGGVPAKVTSTLTSSWLTMGWTEFTGNPCWPIELITPVVIVSDNTVPVAGGGGGGGGGGAPGTVTVKLPGRSAPPTVVPPLVAEPQSGV